MELPGAEVSRNVGIPQVQDIGETGRAVRTPRWLLVFWTVVQISRSETSSVQYDGSRESEIRRGVEGSGLAGRHYDINEHVSPRIKTLSILLRTWMVWVRWARAVDVFTQINASVEVALVA